MAEIKVLENGYVTAAKGYKVATMRAGIKASATCEDMTLLVSDVVADVAGTFTRNLVKAAPVQRDAEIVLNKKKAQAVVINTGIANAVTGQPGLDACVETAKAAGGALGLDQDLVLTASTGVIGVQLPVDKIVAGARELAGKITTDEEAAHKAALAIMTTDTKAKEIAVEFEIGGKTCRIGAMCKGSGMIHPNMGTMLGFMMSDVAIDADVAETMLRQVIEKTFNMVSVDGDTSTNDTVLLFANGLAENEKITGAGEALDIFTEAVTVVAEFLAKNIAKDGEGATRLFTAEVVGAKDYETAKTLAKAVITSNLTKAAIFGKDANWGRIFCAMGYSGADFDPAKTDIWMKSSAGEIKLVENGMATDFSEDKALEILSPDEVTAYCDVKSGDGKATAWGCDLTYDYVSINADYRS